ATAGCGACSWNPDRSIVVPQPVHVNVAGGFAGSRKRLLHVGHWMTSGMGGIRRAPEAREADSTSRENASATRARARCWVGSFEPAPPGLSPPPLRPTH